LHHDEKHLYPRVVWHTDAMEIGARDIHDKQFHDAWRGYNQKEVDDFLDKVAEAIDELQRENKALQSRVHELDQTVAATKSTEEMLKKTLLTAQQAAEEAIAKAKARAEQLIGEAEDRLKRADEETTTRVTQAEADIRQRALQADREYTARKRELDGSIERLRAFESELRVRLSTYLDHQQKALAALRSGPEPPVVRAGIPSPETHPGIVRRTSPSLGEQLRSARDWAHSPLPPERAAGEDRPGADARKAAVERTEEVSERGSPEDSAMGSPESRQDTEAPGSPPPQDSSQDLEADAADEQREPEPARRQARGLFWRNDT
jgi:cell division initiation protein